MTEQAWYKNKWGLTGAIIMIILNAAGLLAGFPILQAFGAIFLFAMFPILAAIIIPLVIGGWYLGLLAEKIYRSFVK